MANANASPSRLEGRPLGKTRLLVTPLCIGTSPLASMPTLYGYEVDASRAVATVRAALDSPISFMDTSNGYGEGESERRIGQAIREVGGLPDGFVLATKVDPAPRSRDFSAARVRASVEESLERLGLDHLHLLYIHDPERISFEEGMAAGGPVQELIALKNEGLVDNIGVAGGPIDLMIRYVATGEFDVVLTHNRFTLVDRSAEPLLREATSRSVGVVNAAPFGGGMLAKGPSTRASYAYGQGDSSVQARALEMQAICERYEIPLAAAALQFSTRESRISSTVVGVSSPERIDQMLDLFEIPIPAELWDELTPLAGSPSAWLG